MFIVGDQTADNETNAATNAGGRTIAYSAGAGEQTAERDTTSADVGGPTITYLVGDQTIDKETNAAIDAGGPTA